VFRPVCEFILCCVAFVQDGAWHFRVNSSDKLNYWRKSFELVLAIAASRVRDVLTHGYLCGVIWGGSPAVAALLPLRFQALPLIVCGLRAFRKRNGLRWAGKAVVCCGVDSCEVVFVTRLNACLAPLCWLVACDPCSDYSRLGRNIVKEGLAFKSDARQRHWQERYESCRSCSWRFRQRSMGNWRVPVCCGLSDSLF
jgi:hypothetical protein